MSINPAKRRGAGVAGPSPEPVAEPIRVGFVSLGCAKNLVDTQVMAGVLVRDGLQLAASPEQADVILVNTCAFIEDARAEAAESILWACEQKRAGRCRAVVVSGCLPQRYRGRMHQAFPAVDALIGVDELDAVSSVIRLAFAGRKAGFRAPKTLPGRLFEPPLPGLALTGGPFAYLKIAEGCRHACAFCAIPAIRGRLRSRPAAALETEARALLKAGFRELNLVSQDTGAYGADRRGKDTLSSLLKRLDAIPGDFWIRLLYLYPTCVRPALLETVRAARHVCAYLDVPIQHSHPDVLRAMHRADTMEAVTALPVRARAGLPGVALRTTCLVGFPGETEAHFEHLRQYLAEACFDHLGVFVYSPEEGTAAYDRPAPSREIAEERRVILMDQQRQRVRQRLRRQRETESVVLLENRRGSAAQSVWVGRGRDQAPEADGVTRVRGVPDGDAAGRFARVRIHGARGYDLRADWVGWCDGRGNPLKTRKA